LRTTEQSPKASPGKRTEAHQLVSPTHTRVETITIINMSTTTTTTNKAAPLLRPVAVHTPKPIAPKVPAPPAAAKETETLDSAGGSDSAQTRFDEGQQRQSPVSPVGAQNPLNSPKSPSHPQQQQPQPGLATAAATHILQQQQMANMYAAYWQMYTSLYTNAMMKNQMQHQQHQQIPPGLQVSLMQQMGQMQQQLCVPNALSMPGSNHVGLQINPTNSMNSTSTAMGHHGVLGCHPQTQRGPQAKKRKIDRGGRKSGDALAGDGTGRQSRSKKCAEASQNKVCSNCGTSSTPFWRKNKNGGLPLCNACGLYFSKNDAMRPRELWRGSSDTSAINAPAAATTAPPPAPSPAATPSAAPAAPAPAPVAPAAPAQIAPAPETTAPTDSVKVEA